MQQESTCPNSRQTVELPLACKLLLRNFRYAAAGLRVTSSPSSLAFF